MKMKNLLLYMISLLIVTNYSYGEELISAECQATSIGDSIIEVHVIIHNNENNEGMERFLLSNIYLPISDWIISGNTNTQTIVDPPLLDPEMMEGVFIYFPSRYGDYKSITNADWSNSILDYLKYLPKIAEIQEGDSIEMKFIYRLDDNSKLIDTTSYDIEYNVPYIQLQQFTEIEEIINDISSYILKEKQYEFDLNKIKKAIKKRNYEYYTKRKLTDCEKQLLKISIIDQVITCRCQIKRK
jgi:hypothetical protein